MEFSTKSSRTLLTVWFAEITSFDKNATNTPKHSNHDPKETFENIMKFICNRVKYFTNFKSNFNLRSTNHLASCDCELILYQININNNVTCFL